MFERSCAASKRMSRKLSDLRFFRQEVVDKHKSIVIKAKIGSMHKLKQTKQKAIEGRGSQVYLLKRRICIISISTVQLKYIYCSIYL